MVTKEALITGMMLMLVTYTLGLSLVSQAFPAGQTSTTFSSTGSIQIQTSAGIGVYLDSECGTQLDSMSWGTLQPGGSQTTTCYIKNEGSSATTLSLETDGWSPTSAETYLNLNWDYSGDPINPNEMVQVTLTLSVDSSIEGISSFSFDITIVGTS
ncbi:MAG: hypothetical protein NWF06_05440 [Candidatus Bathyarchaeota archaeon]|nr:hypothetical protein [Candidatus Bathyarchaeum sp.]